MKIKTILKQKDELWQEIILRDIETQRLRDKASKLRQKLEKNNKEKENYFVKYRTLYMKYKHQQNNFEKTTNQYKEVIRLLQAEIIQNASNEELFEKVEKLNKLKV